MSCSVENKLQHPTITITEDIEILEADSVRECVLTPEGNVKLRNYRLIGPGPVAVRAYTPTGDINTTPTKGKLVPRFEQFDDTLAPRYQILDLIKSDDFENETLEAIIRPLHRKCSRAKQDEFLTDEMITFLQRNQLSPSPTKESEFLGSEAHSIRYYHRSRRQSLISMGDQREPLSLAEELMLVENPWREIEHHRFRSSAPRRETMLEYHKKFNVSQLVSEELDTEELECDNEQPKFDHLTEEFLCIKRRIYALKDEARKLHHEITDIREDLQEQEHRTVVCIAAAGTLDREAKALNFLDHVLSLLHGEVDIVSLARNWPFMQEGKRKNPSGNYIV